MGGIKKYRVFFFGLSYNQSTRCLCDSVLLLRCCLLRCCLLRCLLQLFRNVCGTPIVTVIIHLHTHKRQQNIITLHTHKRQQNIITLNLYDKEWVVHNNNNNNYNNNYNSNNNRETNRARWWSSKRSAHCNITPSFFTHVPATGLVTAGLTHCAVV